MQKSQASQVNYCMIRCAHQESIACSKQHPLAHGSMPYQYSIPTCVTANKIRARWHVWKEMARVSMGSFSSCRTVIHYHCICAYNHTVHTECIITPCTGCQQPFRTYVPDTICRLPDGGSVFYREAQTQCPFCDPSGFGTFWNMDLFPVLQPRDVAIPKSDAGNQLMSYTLSLYILVNILTHSTHLSVLLGLCSDISLYGSYYTHPSHLSLNLIFLLMKVIHLS